MAFLKGCGKRSCYDLAASWTTHDGIPALHVDFDFSSANSKVGSIDIDVNVSCPSGVSEAIVNALTSGLRNELHGSHDIHTSGRDLDLWVTFQESGGALAGGLDLDFDVSHDSMLGHDQAQQQRLVTRSTSRSSR